MRFRIELPDNSGDAYEERQASRFRREADETSPIHTRLLQGAGIIDHLVQHNQRYRSINESLPVIDEASAVFGVCFDNGAIEIRGWWNNLEARQWVNRRRDWRWSLRILPDGTHLLGYDQDSAYALNSRQALVINQLVSETRNFESSESFDEEVVDFELYKELKRFPAEKHAITSVPLAPRPAMSPLELMEFYFPANVDQKLEAISATSRWLSDVLSHSAIYADQLSRVMVLLLKARAALNKCAPQQDIETTNTLGIYLARNRPLIATIAARSLHSQHSLEFEDLIIQGQIGLMEALERVDLGLPNEVITFARSRIKGAIVDEIRETGTTIRIPRSVITLKNRLEGDDSTLTGKEKETARKEVAELSLMQVVSLDGLVGNGDDHKSLLDLVDDPHNREVEEKKDAASEINIEKVLSLLPRRYDNVVRMYLGVFPYTQSYTQMEIGLQLGVTESRVNQLLNQAWAHLKRSIENGQA